MTRWRGPGNRRAASTAALAATLGVALCSAAQAEDVEYAFRATVTEVVAPAARPNRGRQGCGGDSQTFGR